MLFPSAQLMRRVWLDWRMRQVELSCITEASFAELCDGNGMSEA